MCRSTLTEYEASYAYMTIDYKSGKRHVHEDTVAGIRARANRINKRSVRWIKVVIPHPYQNLQAVCIWEINTNWTRTIVRTPNVKG